MNERPAAPVRRLRAMAYALAALAASALIALLVAMGNVGATQAELARARGELAQAEQQVAAVAAERDQLAQALAGATTLGTLTGKGGHAALFQSTEGELVLAAQLPPLGPAQVYQLWLSAG
ncbi:MAG: anti-sigma factor, partial [Chloroflexales bacterium]